MEMRNWLMQELEYALVDHIEMIDIINNTPDESLEDILDSHFGECIFNIQRNYDFMQMIITRIKPHQIVEELDESVMTNGELDKYFKENVKQLMGLIPII